jgi:hypothetical protein
MAVDGPVLMARYNVVNGAAEPLCAMHHLLGVPHAARPAGLLTRLPVDWADGLPLEQGSAVTVSEIVVAGGCPVNLTTVPTDCLRVAMKLFGTRPERAASVETDAGRLAIGGDDSIMDLGVAVNYGALPRPGSGRSDGAIDPGIGNTDALGGGISDGRTMVVKPSGQQRWTAWLQVGRSDEPRPESWRLSR